MDSNGNVEEPERSNITLAELWDGPVCAAVAAQNAWKVASGRPILPLSIFPMVNFLVYGCIRRA
jgi:hypothetical protein